MSSAYALFYDWLFRDAAMASIKAAYLIVAAPLRVQVTGLLSELGKFIDLRIEGPLTVTCKFMC